MPVNKQNKFFSKRKKNCKTMKRFSQINLGRKKNVPMKKNRKKSRLKKKFGFRAQNKQRN